MLEIKVLALDLERTLVSDAMNREQRLGLFDFLTFCIQHFPRVALFTSVSKPQATAVIEELIRKGHAPPAFADKLEYIAWDGKYKDLRFVPDAALDEVLF